MSDLRDINSALFAGNPVAESELDLVQKKALEAKKIESEEAKLLAECKAPRTEEEAWRIF